MHTHGVDVLYGADDDHIVCHVAHDLQLVLLPPEQRLLNEHLLRVRRGEACPADVFELGPVVGDASARASKGEGRAHDERELAYVLGDGKALLERGADAGGRRLEADAVHGLLEELAVLGGSDGGEGGPDEAHAETVERAGVGERDGKVERGLAAHGGEQRVGALGGDDALDERRRHGPDVGAVGEARVGHDGGRVGVDEHDLVALIGERLARLRARVVELARLPDNDGPSAEDHDLLDALQTAGLGRRGREAANRDGGVAIGGGGAGAHGEGAGAAGHGAAHDGDARVGREEVAMAAGLGRGEAELGRGGERGGHGGARGGKEAARGGCALHDP